MYSLGYVKDALAVVIFLFLFTCVALYDLHRNKNLMMGLLIIGATVDMIFTLYPDLHNMEM